MKTLGLTGGIATGKSTVATMLRERGITVIDADDVARSLLSVGSPTLAALVDALGPDILLEDGSLDRAGMRERIGRDADTKHTLDAITHPAIFVALQSIISEHRDEDVVAVEAALMVESGSAERYDVLWVVSCSPATQLSRVLLRDGMQEADAKAFIATQMPLTEKEAAADLVLWNDGDRAALEAALESALKSL